MAVFLVAALGKVFDRPGFRRALGDFGVPDRVGPALTVVVPLAELGVAIGFVPTSTDRWAATVAFGLLALFTGAMAVAIRRGMRPRCRCFGRLGSGEIGSRSLARNGAFALGAGFVALFGSQHRNLSATAWTAGLNGHDWAALAVAAVFAAALMLQGWLVVHLLRQNGRLLVRVAALEVNSETNTSPPPVPDPWVGLPIGSAAPDFNLPELDGAMVSLEELRTAGAPVLLVFTDPRCGPCQALLPDLGRLQREYSAGLTVAVLSTGGSDANRAKSAAAAARVLIQDRNEVAEAYLFPGTPSAVLVGVDGRIASRVAGGADAIRALVTATLPDRTMPWALTMGQTPVQTPEAGVVGRLAPAFVLPDLDGQNVESARFRGHETLLVFWNPACGYCQQMVPALRNWQARRSERDPALVVVSRGSVEAIRAMGLESLVLLDTESSIASSFGATGTPMAVLLDSDGRVASTVAAGAQEVMALAGRNRHWLLADARSDR